MNLQSIKVLSLLQPWASLVVLGHKKIETRSFRRNYRGPVLIHASKGAKEAKRLCNSNIDCTNPFSIAGHWAELPYGAIIGQVQLIDVVRFKNSRPGDCLFSDVAKHKRLDPLWDLTEQEYAFGNYNEGRYGWLLSNPIVFRKPIPCKGNLGLWVPPADVLEQVEEQVKAADHGR